jgi:hypothetical protein
MHGNGTPDVPVRLTRRTASRAGATSPASTLTPASTRGGRPAMRRRLSRSLLGLTLAGALLGPAAPALLADGDGAPPAPAAGGVLALRQTPHLWVVDAAGAAHLAADPPALAAHAAAGAPRTEVALDDLRRLPRGEPWLSLPLVRLGEFVYLPQTAADGEVPVLRLVMSAEDLHLIGVDAENYGRLVLDRQAWEARTGLRVDALRYDALNLDGHPFVQPVYPESNSETATA